MNHDRQKREEIVPVAVTLRNAYAPYQQKSRDFKSSINGHDDHEHDNDNDHEQERCPISVFVAPNPNPIEMELVAPYSLLVQLKHSYKNDEVIKNKISAQFGLGKMEHENSGKNDADVNRFIPICSKNTWEWECNCECDCEYEYGGNMGLGAEFGMHSNGSCTIESELESNHQLQHQQQQKQASHPLWDHVNERLDDLHETLVTLPNKHHSDCDFEGNDNDNSEVTRRDTKLRERIWDDIRNHVRIQCKVHVHAIIPPSDDDPSTSNTNTNTNTNTNLILASVPLNLRRLVQLPVNQLDDHTSAMSVSDEEPKILGVSKYNNSIPHSLPRNSILVHFSDGSTRVSPSLYDLLVKRNVIVDVPISIGSGGDGNANASTSASTSTSTNLDIDVDKFERRFEDDIFNVLGDVKSKSPTTRMRNGIGNGNDGNGQIHGHNSHGHEGINNGHPDQYKKVKLKFNNASSIQDTSSNSSHSHRHLNSDQTKTLNGNGNGNGNGSSISPRQNGIQHGNASKGSMRGSFADAFESLAISPAPVKGVHTKAASQTNNEEVLMTSMELSDDEDSESAEDLMIHSNNTTLHSADCETSSSIIASNHNMCTTRYNEANNSCSEVVTSEDIVNRIQDLDDEMELLQRVLDLEETVLNSEDEEQQTVSYSNFQCTMDRKISSNALFHYLSGCTMARDFCHRGVGFRR